MSSYGGLFPNLTRRLFDAGRTGDLETALAVHHRMIQLAEGLFGHIKSRHLDGAFDKILTWLRDPEYPRRLLPPYEPILDEDAAIARDYYETHCGDLS